MKKSILAIIGLAGLGALISYGAMSYNTTHSAPATPAVSLAGDMQPTLVKSSEDHGHGDDDHGHSHEQAEEVSLESLAPNEVYVGFETESGNFTGDVIDGDPDAPVTIIEYASLTCSHCASFHAGPYKELKEKYIDTGKVRLLYRDYPLDNPALAGTMIARCAGQDRYLSFVDVMLTQQRSWTSSNDILGALKNIAKLGGLSPEAVDACLTDQALGQNVIDRMQAASAVHRVTSTPTLIINGEKYSGSRDINTLSSFIDDLLD